MLVLSYCIFGVYVMYTVSVTVLVYLENFYFDFLLNKCVIL